MSSSDDSDEVFLVPVRGSFLIGSVLEGAMILSSESRGVLKVKDNLYIIDTEPAEGGFEVEKHFNKSFVKEDYAVVSAGKHFVISEILLSLEAEACKLRNVGSKVDVEILSTMLTEKMNSIYAKKGREHVGCTKFIMVALNEKNELHMRGFGFNFGSSECGVKDVDSFWLAGASREARDVGRDCLSKEYDKNETSKKMFSAHHRVMEAVSHVYKAVGGNHKMVTASVDVNGQFKTKIDDCVIEPGYRRRSTDVDMFIL